MKKEYIKDGIAFSSDGRAKLQFPLNIKDKAYRQSFKNQEWERYAILEQLWIEGCIEESREGTYVLPYKAIYDIDDEDRELIGIPSHSVELKVSEIGNIGSSNYKIRWDAYRNGINLGFFEKHGNVLRTNGNEYLLNEAQYKLACDIDGLVDDGAFSTRAKNIALIKNEAAEASALVDSFTDSRNFFYVDKVALACDNNDDQKINLHSQVDDAPEELSQNGAKPVSHAFVLSKNQKQNYVFFSDEAKKKYNSYNSLSDIQGSDVPKFIDNPLSYIPEDIEFDQDNFAKRVKGLKIHKSSANPFVRIEKRESDTGWFDVDIGVEIDTDNCDFDKFTKENELDAKEYRELITKAKETGEPYVYYKDQWIKVDSKEGEDFLGKCEENGDEFGTKKVSRENLRKILDIYDNIEGVNYSELGEENAQKQKSAEEIKRYQVPNIFVGKLKDYQQDGYSFLCSQFHMKKGSLLADDMGLGKTIQVIAFMSYLYSIGELWPTLLVVPKALIENWEEEIQKNAPVINQCYVHTGAERHKNVSDVNGEHIVITTYETLARDQLILGQIHWKLMICDETQKIKNYRTLAASAAKGMNTDCRIALTGTPVENRLGELWSIIDFIQPGLLGSFTSFSKKYEQPIQEHASNEKALIDELVSIINPVFLRRMKDDVLAGQLPEKIEHFYEVSLNPLQTDYYLRIIRDTRSDDDKLQVLSAIQKLIELCGHPRALQGSLDEDANKLISESGKMQNVVRLLNEIKKRNEKVLIFTTYKKLQRILKKVVYDEYKIDAKVINGEMKESRAGVVKDFNESHGFNVLILSPRAAGVGLTITGANNVIHYTREWNPAVENQATDRVYRIGQQRDVNVYYPISSSKAINTTVDQKLNSLLESKRELMRNVVVPSGIEITIDELQSCLTSV